MQYLRTGRELLTMAKDWSNWLVGEKTDILRIECMNDLGIYNTTINVQGPFAKWVTKRSFDSKSFPKDQIYSIKLLGLKPYPVTISHAIIESGNEYKLDFSKCLDFETLVLEVAYRMDPEWLRGLVFSRSSPEAIEERLKYNLIAGLCNPSSLEHGFSRVDVNDYPISARIHIQESICTNIPQYVSELARIEAEIQEDYDPRHGTKVHALQMQKAELKTRLGKEGLVIKLRDLGRFLRPMKFLDFVAVHEDFRLHCCQWGDEVFRLFEMLTFPTSMNVISRTDLSLGQPAAKGYLIYESKKFENEVASYFGGK